MNDGRPDIYAGISEWDADHFTSFSVSKLVLPVHVWRGIIQCFFNPILGNLCLFQLLWLALVPYFFTVVTLADETTSSTTTYGSILGALIVVWTFIGMTESKAKFFFLIDQVFDLNYTERKILPDEPREQQL